MFTEPLQMPSSHVERYLFLEDIFQVMQQQDQLKCTIQ